MHRSRFCAVLLTMLLAACAPGAQQAADSPADTPIIPVLAASELTIGVNRLPFGLLQAGTPLNQPDLSLGIRLFTADDPTTPVDETTAVYRGEGLPVGLYVAYVTFDQPGAWEAEISIPQANGDPQVSRMRLDVLETPRAPAVGSQAIPTDNLTVADMPLEQITSDPDPDPDLYQLTVTDALAADKPFLVSFSTPGYCQTAVCAPNIAVTRQLKEAFGGQVNFLHIEVYPYPFGDSFKAGRRVQAMDDWNLRTEPWTFLVDAGGTIQARYEGGITLAELQPALAQLAAGQPVELVQ